MNRRQIDELDDQLLDILHQRMKVVSAIGNDKKANNMTILQPARWDSILNKHLKRSRKKALSRKMISRVFTAIHQESIRRQTKIMNGL